VTARLQSGICWRVKTRYPLEALKVLREAQTDRCVQSLAAARHSAAAAAAELARAQEKLESERATNVAIARETREELEAGHIRAADLMLAGDFARAGAAREQALSRVQASAEKRVDDAARARTSAQLALGSARSQQSALERHQSEWRAARMREGEAKEEEAALERWNAERFGPGRR
jgi:hypothetical protein